MPKTPTKSPDEPKPAPQKRGSRANFDIAFHVPKGLSVSTSTADAAKAYYTSDPSSEDQQSSQWGGKGAALLNGQMPSPRSHIHVLSHQLLEDGDVASWYLTVHQIPKPDVRGPLANLADQDQTQSSSEH
jgi:hypothetical protein